MYGTLLELVITNTFDDWKKGMGTGRNIPFLRVCG
jgi:hypothetical protein